MSKSYFYIETAFHHEGDLNYLKELIYNAKLINADGVKFQVLTNIDDFVAVQHSGYDILKKYCFSYNQWSSIFEYTKGLDLDIILMPLNKEALKLVDVFPIKYIDIHSVSFNDIFLLEEINNYHQNIILGIGGRTFDEIKEKISFFNDKVKVLMVGFQSFPSMLEDVNLGKIKHLVNDFSKFLIGYADHSSFDDENAISSNEYARLLGATIFEKHVTLNEGIERVDYNSAISFEKMKRIIEKINFIESHILIDNNTAYKLNDKERVYRDRQLVCVSNKIIEKGNYINKEDISFKMVSDSNNCITNSSDLIGRISAENILKNQPILKTYIV
ncbi:MAG: N-acetylneuraminate synthase family protein [Flavobacterium sp.]|jgi:N,N'-diacetyllegionaminate synthase|nr:N-acetylneuraminate synthase family protein [Flavobacterium sp.]HQX04628.1 N-acetylneuraminate synthase family protein [Flavobacterium sp.]